MFCFAFISLRVFALLLWSKVFWVISLLVRDLLVFLFWLLRIMLAERPTLVISLILESLLDLSLWSLDYISFPFEFLVPNGEKANSLLLFLSAWFLVLRGLWKLRSFAPLLLDLFIDLSVLWVFFFFFEDFEADLLSSLWLLAALLVLLLILFFF